MSEQVIWVTHGLATSDRTCKGVPLPQVEAYMAKHSDCFERTLPHEKDERTLNRAYLDLDGRAEADSKEEFDALVRACEQALQLEFGNEGALTTSCQYAYVDAKKDRVYNKLSFGFIARALHGTKSAIKHWAKTSGLERAKGALEGICSVVLAGAPETETLTTFVDIDTAVYNPHGRKMRMLWSSKDKEKRPKTLINAAQASALDTLITFVQAESVALPEPPPPVSAAPAPLLARAAVAPGAAAPDGVEPKHALLRRVLGGIKATREWIRVGMACKNEGLPLEAWDAWSSPHPEYKPGDCAKRWPGFKASALSQAFLWKLLKADNPALFAELQAEREDFWNLLGEFNHAACAQFFYNCKPDAYAYSPKLRWFQLLPSGAWQQTDEVPSGLKSDLWKTLKAACLEHMATLDVNMEADKLRMQACKRFLTAIGSATFVEGIAKFLPTNYEDLDLHERMDETRNLFAFRDKVVELDTGVVRDIRPTDYVCLTTGYDYPQAQNPAMRERINALFYSFWEDGTMTEFVLNLIANQAFGQKSAEEVYVLTGTGRNGKGLQAELVKRAFGNYFQSCEHNLITKKSDKKDSPNPALFRAKGKRILQVQEPESDDKLQVGTIKELRGGDLVTARDLYTRGGGVSYVPQFSLWIQCNTVPKLNKLDRAIGLSLVVIPFPLQFVENPAGATERKIDTSLKAAMSSDNAWRDEFILMLLERALGNKGKKLAKPAQVQEASNEYLASNDPVGSWLRDNFVFEGLDTHDKRFKIPASSLLKRFLADTDTASHDMSADRFKELMTVVNGVGFRRESNPFDGIVWTDAGVGLPKRHGSGSYYVGIRPRQSPDVILSEAEDAPAEEAPARKQPAKPTKVAAAAEPEAAPRAAPEAAPRPSLSRRKRPFDEDCDL